MGKFISTSDNFLTQLLVRVYVQYRFSTNQGDSKSSDCVTILCTE